MLYVHKYIFCQAPLNSPSVLIFSTYKIFVRVNSISNVAALTSQNFFNFYDMTCLEKGFLFFFLPEKYVTLLTIPTLYETFSTTVEHYTVKE